MSNPQSQVVIIAGPMVRENRSCTEPGLIALGGRDRPLGVMERDAWENFSETNRE
jgi:hypothetical protein